MLFGRLDVDIWMARGGANALVIPFIAVATARNTGWTIEMHVSRGAVFHSTAILVSGVFLLVVAGAGYIVRYLGGEWGRALQIELVFAALLRRRPGRDVGQLPVASCACSSASTSSRTATTTARSGCGSRARCPADDVAARRPGAKHPGARRPGRKSGRRAVAAAGGRGLPPGSRWNMPAPDAVEPRRRVAAAIPRAHRLGDRPDRIRADPTRYAGSRGSGSGSERCRRHGSSFRSCPAPTWSDSSCLRSSRATIEVNWEVRDLLKTASRQAASYLGQIRATEALLEARKFDAFNRMSAFVVHDLKNLVAQLSLMLRNAERHRDNPGIPARHADDGRARGRPDEPPDAAAAHRRDACREAAPDRPRSDRPSRLRGAARQRRRRSTSTSQPGLLALGHEDRLDHVIGHLIQNALDATTGGGRVQRAPLPGRRLRGPGSDAIPASA